MIGDCHDMKPLPDSVKKLIEAKTFANIATLMPDGSPTSLKHGSTTMGDGDLVLINTIEGSLKHKNVLRNPRVALDICDPANAFNVAVIRGRVKEVTFKGADEHVDRLAKKYLGQDKYQSRRPGMRRVLFKIEPLHIVPPFTDTTPRKST